MSKVNDAWEKLFKELDIVKEINKDGFFKLNAEEIEDKTGVQPRHMGNRYKKEDLPDVFVQNNINMLPSDNGEYFLGKFNAYESLPIISTKPTQINFNQEIKTLKYDKIKTETDALAYLECSTMFNFINPKREACKISGNKRTNTDPFTFKVGTYEVDVKSVQFEVDQYYEFENSIVIMEAKICNKSRIDNFLVRQLYYPFRFFYDQCTGKDVIPVFMIFNPKNKTYSFYKYKFIDPMRYDSIKLIKQESYQLNPPVVMPSIFKIA